MKPKFANEQAWQQAEILMQPAYIRLVDQIRRQTEENDHEILVSYEEVTDPYPSNLLCLQPRVNAHNSDHIGDHQTQPLLKVDIWDLCFQVCFENYEPIATATKQTEQLVAIDTSLFDPHSQEVDWSKLDEKAQITIRQVFARFKLLNS
jgi:hypothetical protein